LPGFHIADLKADEETKGNPNRPHLATDNLSPEIGKRQDCLKRLAVPPRGNGHSRLSPASSRHASGPGSTGDADLRQIAGASLAQFFDKGYGAFTKRRLRPARGSDPLCSLSITLSNLDGGLWRSLEGDRYVKVRLISYRIRTGVSQVWGSGGNRHP
jgi:hypothetical protein